MNRKKQKRKKKLEILKFCSILDLLINQFFYQFFLYIYIFFTYIKMPNDSPQDNKERLQKICFSEKHKKFFV